MLVRATLNRVLIVRCVSLLLSPLKGVPCVWPLLCSLCTAQRHTMATLDLEKSLKPGSCVVCKMKGCHKACLTCLVAYHN